MIEAELFDGTVLEFPDGTDPAIVQRKVKELTMQRRAAAGDRVPAPFTPDKLERLRVAGVSPEATAGAAEADAIALDQMDDRSMVRRIMEDDVAPAAAATARTVTNFSEGLGRGVVNFAGTPANVASAAPLAANLLPGEQGMVPAPQMLAEADPRVRQLAQALLGPMYTLIKPAVTSDGTVVPAAGSERIQDLFGQGADAITNATGLEIRNSPAFEEAGMVDRFAQRIGEEIGFSGPMLGSALRSIANSGTNLASRAAEKLLNKELGVAAISGATAQGAREIAEATGRTPADDGEIGSAGWDMAGSLFGSMGLPAGYALGRAATSLGSGVVGGSAYLDEVAELAVRDLAIQNSLDANRYADQTGSVAGFDTTDMVNRLRNPAKVEELVPGYRATTGQRLNDPMMRTFEETLDATSPGVSNVRRLDNNRAVNTRVDQLAPDGDPAVFRRAIQDNVDARLQQSQAAVGSARAAYDDAVARLEVLEDNASALARGGAMREGLQEVYDSELAKVSDMMEQVRNSNTPVDLSALQARFDKLTESLFANDRSRFTPSEADTLRAIIPEAVPTGPTPSSVLDASGRPIMRPPAQPASTTGPIGEVMSLRGGISNDIGAAADEPQRRFVLGQYRNEIDQFIDTEVPEDLRDLYREATALRADVGSRFESNDAVGRALATDGRGNFTQRPEQLPGALVPASDAGNVTDYSKMMAEAGSNPRVRQAVQDTVATRAQKHLTDPIAMARFIDQNNIVLKDFPDLKAQLEQAGATKSVLDAAENASNEVTKRLTTPGRSPEASYLRYGDNDTVSSMRTVVTSDRPAESARALLDAAGNTPDAVNGARSALWSVITEDGTNRATAQGDTVWNPGIAAKKMRDPKIEAAARELWGQDYGDFEIIRSIFEELEATRPGQMRSAGNPSGTAAAVALSPGAKLSPARVSADLRAVSQNRTSPLQVGIQWASDKLRNMSSQKQQAWVDKLMRVAIDEPGRLADILEKYNPALEQMANRNIGGYKGVRGSQIAALLEELAGTEQEDETVDTIMRAE